MTDAELAATLEGIEIVRIRANIDILGTEPIRAANDTLRKAAAALRQPKTTNWRTDVGNAYKDATVILATKCGKVTASKWLEGSGRWQMLAKDEQPIAWQPWPSFPEACHDGEGGNADG